MTEGRQPFTAEIKTLAKGPSTYDPLDSGRPRHWGLPLRLHRIQLAERSDRHERPARRFVIYADSTPPHKSCRGGRRRRALGGDERAHRNFCLRYFSVLGGLAPRLSSAVICNKSVSYKIVLTQDGPATSHRLDQVRRIGEQDD
jgi:hypothetical protein